MDDEILARLIHLTTIFLVVIATSVMRRAAAMTPSLMKTATWRHEHSESAEIRTWRPAGVRMVTSFLTSMVLQKEVPLCQILQLLLLLVQL